MRLYAGRGDKDVAYDNSRYCLRELRVSGVKAALKDVGDVDHTTTARRSLPEVLDWFVALRGA
uniref:Peptidase S9 prolyl oligopeptidase catalytic domain-containing protein n=1 Tax=Nonomuraea gerenzanensis TaxID=93944 RepID=A0A1M4DWS2_9ACTN|nr:hypothetical protein BN4615_P495 [Nonomuraea gerenzanensis]